MALDANLSGKDGDMIRMESTVTLDRESVDGKDYDPYQHRHVAHPTSTLGAFFHLLKSSLGSGLLAMPAAFKHTGLIPGFMGTMLVAIIATHCVHILRGNAASMLALFHVNMIFLQKLEKASFKFYCNT